MSLHSPRPKYLTTLSSVLVSDGQPVRFSKPYITPTFLGTVVSISSTCCSCLAIRRGMYLSFDFPLSHRSQSEMRAVPIPCLDNLSPTILMTHTVLSSQILYTVVLVQKPPLAFLIVFSCNSSIEAKITSFRHSVTHNDTRPLCHSESIQVIHYIRCQPTTVCII